MRALDLSPPVVSDTGPADNAAIAHHYDSLDRYYRELWGEHVHHGMWLTGRETPAAAAENMSLRVLNSLELKSGSRVADIGCGYGATARMAASIFGAEVTGLTLSVAQKNHADSCEVGNGKVEVCCDDWRDHDFAEGSLDALFALESLEHMADKAAFADMARRAVRPGGRVVVATWLAADDVAPWKRRHFLEAICREGRLAPLVTMGQLRRIFSRADFEEIEVADLSSQVSQTWTVVLRRLAWGLLAQPAYWRFLLGGGSRDAIFAVTAARIRLAYATGCFRYGFLVVRRRGE